jgi:hypothetical protein
MNEPKTQNTNEGSEYENFEKLAKKLLHLSPEELEKIKREEKEQGIEPDAADFAPEEEEENNN